MKENQSQNSSSKSKIIVALDVANASKAQILIEKLFNYVGGFKVGLELFSSEGPTFVQELTSRGISIFLDLKYHDIPNTVSNASKVATRLKVDMFNVHAAGGKEMMRKAAESAGEEAVILGVKRPKILAVTILTSLDDIDLRMITGSLDKVVDHVRRRAISAREAGLDGVIASPREIEIIRKDCGEDFLIITPGVRPKESGEQDQKRIMTPREAIKLGADYLVIGRPICQAKNPVVAACEIVREIEL